MFVRNILDFARDGQHPGAATQRVFAEQAVADPEGPATGFGFIT